MAKRNVIVELKHGKKLSRSAAEAAADPKVRLDTGVLPTLDNLACDEGFTALALPGSSRRTRSDDPYDTNPELLELDPAAEATTYLVRGECEDDRLEALQSECEADSRTTP